MKIGEKIRASRNEKNLTLVELSKLSGISYQFLSDVERGRRNPSPENIQRIASSLDIPMTDLLPEKIMNLLQDIDLKKTKLRYLKGLKEQYEDALENISVDNQSEYDLQESEKEHSSLSTDMAQYDKNIKSENAGLEDYSYFLENAKPIMGKMIRVPILGKIPAGTPIEAKENIIDYVTVPQYEVTNGSYFYLQVEGDSMINSGIKNGYRVLVKKQPDVENGEIAVVRVNHEDATLKRVKKVDGQIILYPDNPNYDPIFIKEEGAEIIGKVVKVEFDPNKRY